MIAITRTQLPPKLIQALEEARRHLEDRAKDSSQERLRFDTSVLKRVKPALMEMCRGKCAYCESRLDVVSRGEVENFRPKGGARGFETDSYAPQHYWWLAFDWDN